MSFNIDFAGDLRARALLCPLSSRGQPVPMTYRKLTIGTGEYWINSDEFVRNVLQLLF